MVWIFFLSTNRNYLQRNQLSAPTLGPETHTQYFYLFQIESSGTFLTSHFATMLYHIVSDNEKLVQFRWSGFFSYQQTGTTCNGINYRHLPSDWNRMDIPSIFPKSNLLELFSQATFPQCYVIQCKTLHIWVRSDGLDFSTYQQTGTTCNGINYRHLPSDRKRLDKTSISSKSNLLILFSQATFPQCYIIQCKTLHNWVRSDGLDFFPINRNYLQRNQLSAPTLGPETLTQYFYLIQIDSSGTFLTSHFATMLYHIVSDTGKIGSVPMVWIFFLSTNRNYLQRNQLSASYPRTGNAWMFLLSFPNRIFWNFSHKPLFHNAISKSVRHSIFGSDPMVWIFYLSTNRNYLQRNQLSAPTLGPETLTQYFFFFQIESSGTFLTSHFSTMLYHIVQDTPILGHFRWSGFFSYQQTGTTCNGINYRHLPSDWNRMDIPSIFPKSNLLELFSQATFPQCYIIQCKTLHIWVRSDGLDFSTYQQTGTTCNGINYRHLPSDRKRLDKYFYLFQIESSNTFLTSHFSTMLYHIV